MELMNQLRTNKTQTDRQCENTISHNRCRRWFDSGRWMIHGLMAAAVIWALILSPTPGVSGIYKYKDKNGKWVFTDAPSADADNMATVKKDSSELHGVIDLEKTLWEKFKPKTPIEEATLGTVTVKTKTSSGSGFFVTNTGYIITNKHVIRIDKKQYQKAREKFEQVGEKVDQFEAQLLEEQRRLKEFKKKLDEYKREVYTETLYLKRKRMKRAYERELARYQEWQRDFDKRKSAFYQVKRNYNNKKQAFDHKMSSANVARHFTIILKDRVELDVHLVALSAHHDLALLKLDGYKTPFLRLAPAVYTPQGASVYAIGSPVGIRDSVASGILSGYTDKYIKTDAPIYPGNSGGPLVNDEGGVIGINTLKRITYRFEGLGFAIPIQTALDAFQSELRGWTATAN